MNICVKWNDFMYFFFRYGLYDDLFCFVDIGNDDYYSLFFEDKDCFWNFEWRFYVGKIEEVCLKNFV